VICELGGETFKVLKINELITLMTQLAVITRNQSDLQHSQASLQVKRREGGSDLDINDSPPGKAQASPFAEARNVVPIIHMHDESALIHPVRPGATGWTVGIATGS
jgi:hypothetical protein